MFGERGEHSNHERQVAKDGAFDRFEGIPHQRNDGENGTLGVSSQEKSLLQGLISGELKLLLSSNPPTK